MQKNRTFVQGFVIICASFRKNTQGSFSEYSESSE
jgi:hypothetical protein